MLQDGRGYTPSIPNRGDTRAASLDIYDDLTDHNPFRPSQTWSTVPMTDEWVDETCESPMLSRSTSQLQQNWRILQESPVITGGGDASAPISMVLEEAASSARLPQVQEGEGVQEQEREGGSFGGRVLRAGKFETWNGDGREVGGWEAGMVGLDKEMPV